MAFDGLFRDREFVRHDLVCISRGNQFEHVDFTGSQRVVCKVIGNLRGDFGRNSLVPRVDGTNCIQEFSA